MILDEFGKPVRTSMHAILLDDMNRATQAMQATLVKQMFKVSPRVLDQFGNNLLPPEGPDGFLDVLKDPRKHSWGGARVQENLEFAPREIMVPIIVTKGRSAYGWTDLDGSVHEFVEDESGTIVKERHTPAPGSR